MAGHGAYARRFGNPVLVVNKPAREKAVNPAVQPPAAPEPPKKSIFEEYNLDELMSRSAKVISDFIAAHEDELGLSDFQAMLDREMAGKKRSTVIAGLQAHLGG